MKIQFITRSWRSLRHTCFLIAGLLYLSTAQADPFADGLAAYEASEYTTALDHFQAAAEQAETPAVRHNLALTYFQKGQPAEALWQLERAIALAPFNREYWVKRAALRQQLGLPGDKPRWHTLAPQALTLNGWIWLLTISFWGLLAALILPQLRAHQVGLGIKTIRVLTALGLIAAAPATWFSLRTQQAGVIIAAEPVPLRIAPASAAPQTDSLRPGQRARLLDRHNTFFEIETEGNRTGWIPVETFRHLRIESRGSR